MFSRKRKAQEGSIFDDYKERQEQLRPKTVRERINHQLDKLEPKGKLLQAGKYIDKQRIKIRTVRGKSGRSPGKYF